MPNNTSYTGCTTCQKCGKPNIYVGDVPEGGWLVGFEPYCTCNTQICNKCGQRYIPKPCDHEFNRSEQYQEHSDHKFKKS